MPTFGSDSQLVLIQQSVPSLSQVFIEIQSSLIIIIFPTAVFFHIQRRARFTFCCFSHIRYQMLRRATLFRCIPPFSVPAHQAAPANTATASTTNATTLYWQSWKGITQQLEAGPDKLLYIRCYPRGSDHTLDDGPGRISHNSVAFMNKHFIPIRLSWDLEGPTCFDFYDYIRCPHKVPSDFVCSPGGYPLFHAARHIVDAKGTARGVYTASEHELRFMQERKQQQGTQAESFGSNNEVVPQPSPPQIGGFSAALAAETANQEENQSLQPPLIVPGAGSMNSGEEAMLFAAEAYAARPEGFSAVNPPMSLEETLSWLSIVWSERAARCKVLANEWMTDGVGVKSVAANQNFKEKELNRPPPLREFFCDVRRRQRILRLRSDLSQRHGRSNSDRRAKMTGSIFGSISDKNSRWPMNEPQQQLQQPTSETQQFGQ